MTTQKKWSPLAHEIYRTADFQRLKAKDILVSCSGGVDSMALLGICLELFKPEQIKVIHFHHGFSKDEAIANFRDQAKILVRKFCQEKQIMSQVIRSQEDLLSENDFRNFRQQHYEIEKENRVIALGHHQEDQLETQFQHLLRGAGPRGIRGMRSLDGSHWRPFLTFQKEKLKDYCVQHNISWVNDPSNESSKYQRNWVRNELFPLLTRKDSGALTSLRRSFDLIADLAEQDQALETEILPVDSDLDLSHGNRQIGRVWKVSRVYFESLSEVQKTQLLSLMLRKANIFVMTQGQLKEIRKRLDNEENVVTFEVGSSHWCINAGQILVQSKVTRA